MQKLSVPIRTITLGLADAHPLLPAHISWAARRLEIARKRFQDEGYEVQTVRISTRPLFDDLAGWSGEQLLAYVSGLQAMLDEVSIDYCSLGPAQAAQPNFPLGHIELIPDLLAATRSLNLAVQVADQEHGLRAQAARPTAHAMLRLAQETADGAGNFNFAALACVAPGTPFFPAAYHHGPASLALGLQGAGIVREVAHTWRVQKKKQKPSSLAPQQISVLLGKALEEQARPLVNLGQALAVELGLSFGGIDLSPAPMGEDSIVAALETFDCGPLGSPGTLTLVAALTAALRNTTLPTCGYCGLMLPVLEDKLLAERWGAGEISIHELLLYSAVCGTGLDTVPLPGDIEVSELARLLLDVATLAWRLRKPLSARLFPVPGKGAGELTAFQSPYLTNTRLR